MKTTQSIQIREVVTVFPFTQFSVLPFLSSVWGVCVWKGAVWCISSGYRRGVANGYPSTGSSLSESVNGPSHTHKLCMTTGAGGMDMHMARQCELCRQASRHSSLHGARDETRPDCRGDGRTKIKVWSLSTDNKSSVCVLNINSPSQHPFTSFHQGKLLLQDINNIYSYTYMTSNLREIKVAEILLSSSSSFSTYFSFQRIY